MVKHAYFVRRIAYQKHIEKHSTDIFGIEFGLRWTTHNMVENHSFENKENERNTLNIAPPMIS